MATKKATKKAAKATTVKRTIGSVALQALQGGKSAQQALAAVKKAFPKAATTIGCIYWYASQNGIKLQKPAKAAA